MQFVHPLTTIKTEEDLLGLDYFDFLSCLGLIPLHPGGINATREVIKHAKLKPKSRILEIGSGTGTTTATLVNAGADLTVVEPNKKLLQTTLRNCFMINGKYPDYHLSTIEAIDLPDQKFDFVILEAVFGFFKNRKLAVEKIYKCLKPDGSVGINDFYYFKKPSIEIVASLDKMMGSHLDPDLNAEKWKSYFSKFRLLNWKEAEPKKGTRITAQEIKGAIEAVRALQYLPSERPGLFDAMAEKVNAYHNECSINKEALMSFSAIFKK